LGGANGNGQRIVQIVISQSMYFPWVGLLEQIRLADQFVHYDDVQYTRGFYNRVQIKTPTGPKWLTIPLRDWHRGQHIDEVQVDEREDWRSRHRETLRQNYLKAPFLQEMLKIVDEVFNKQVVTLADISRSSILALAKYFSLETETKFLASDKLVANGSSSQRLRDIVLCLNGDVYITGHGARNYLDHKMFGDAGIEVRYMQYLRSPYPQQHGDFTPYVTGLDLVANCGKNGVLFIQSETLNWKVFLDGCH
jgi:WbqC-like protein